MICNPCARKHIPRVFFARTAHKKYFARLTRRRARTYGRHVVRERTAKRRTMNWILAEGTLEQLRSILTIPGVLHASRGLTPLPGGRYQSGLYVEEGAIPSIEAKGVAVTIVHTQVDLDARDAQLRAEQEPNA